MWLRFRRKHQLLLLTATLISLTILIISNSNSSSPGEDSSSLLQQQVSRGGHRRSPFSRDIHVVVGFYQGNNLPWINSDNFSADVLNTNGYSPDPSSGADGSPVLLPSFESPKSSKLFQINRFNLLASDRIPLNRSLPDVRRKECVGKVYGTTTELPTTSVVIVFHNEAWSTLLRTVHSVINRSPASLVTQIILVDDHSQRSFLGAPLDAHVSHLPVPTRVIRSTERIGLIKARLLGAQHATADTLTFLDAHCEVTKGWLEPLLSRIRTSPTSIVSPVIDIINDDTFQYIRSFELHQGGFNWDLHFRWFSLPPPIVALRQHDPTEPFTTAVMAGGLFSISREFFYSLGAYDPHMQIWGGENLEISFRAWQCGGRLEIVPCSHVGHLFRKSSPYTFPGGVGDTLNTNLARVALVWMDEYAEFVFKLHPEIGKLAENQTTGMLEERHKLRKQLNCKSFEWFLNNVWPHHFFPTNQHFFGRVRSVKSRKCLQSPHPSSSSTNNAKQQTFGQPYGVATTSDCILELYAPQLFSLREGFLKTNDNICLDPPEYKNDHTPTQVRIMACNNLPRQKWEYNKETMQLVHQLSSKCLDLPHTETLPALALANCDTHSQSQKFDLEHVQWRNNKSMQ